MSEVKKEGLDLLREPFPPNQIGKLAKGSKAQMTCDNKEKQNCSICGGWHHPKLIHLDYVGHAALTDRLLDADPFWTWEPVAFGSDGLPVFDLDGGLWIRVTVCGRSMIGYGNAEQSQYKEVGSRQKECIGDALRNACMRLGAALELWHKGDLHVGDNATQGKEASDKATETDAKYSKKFQERNAKNWKTIIDGKPKDEVASWWPANKDDIVQDCGEEFAEEVHQHAIKIYYKYFPVEKK